MYYDCLPERLGAVPGICRLDEDKLFYFGGAYSRGFKDTCYVLDIKTYEWQKLPDLPSTNCHICPVIANGSVYIFGGWNGTSRLNSVWRYNIPKTTGKYSKIALLHLMRCTVLSVEISFCLQAVLQVEYTLTVFLMILTLKSLSVKRVRLC